jgi:GTP cyclohydrolase I
MLLKDIQNLTDDRNVPIDKVGVKNINYPIIVLDKIKQHQHTIASINMFVNLPHHFKGTHMSRFIEILNKFRFEIGISNFHEILEEMLEKLNAESAHLEVSFPYFIEKEAPITQSKGLMEYHCMFIGNKKKNEELDFIISVKAPVTSLCPCSKEISDFGAHNQRSLVKVNFKFKKFVWIEDIIEVIENSSSSPVYSILKRPDEKYVTEKAYNNPMFVEDIVRELALKLKEMEDITWFTIEAENFESIHNHSAYAFIESSNI